MRADRRPYKTYFHSHGKDARWVADAVAQEEISGEILPGHRVGASWLILIFAYLIGRSETMEKRVITCGPYDIASGGWKGVVRIHPHEGSTPICDGG